MKLAYFDCFSGISGDMTLGALVDAGLSARKLRAELKKLKVEGYTISVAKTMKCGIAATKVTVKVKHPGKQKHRHYPDITRIVEKSALSAKVKEKALSIFRVIAEAEATTHGTTVDRVHFHEVGAIDSIVDVVGAAVGLVELGIDEIYASAVNTGSGIVRAAHGVMPVPAPATALILKDAPTYAEGPEKELATPTGAAILKALGQSFGPRPMMTTSAIGYGAGGYDFADWPNVLRVSIGDVEHEALSDMENSGLDEELLVELSTNIDDMSPQFFPPLSERLFEAGALDVALAPIQMKKGRAGFALEVLCHPRDSVLLEEMIFSGTSTLGIRRRIVERVSLPRKIVKVRTKYGVIEIKVAENPGGSVKAAPEFESLKKAADNKDVPLETVRRAAMDAFYKNRG